MIAIYVDVTSFRATTTTTLNSLLSHHLYLSLIDIQPETDGTFQAYRAEKEIFLCCFWRINEINRQLLSSLLALPLFFPPLQLRYKRLLLLPFYNPPTRILPFLLFFLLFSSTLLPNLSFTHANTPQPCPSVHPAIIPTTPYPFLSTFF